MKRARSISIAISAFAAALLLPSCVTNDRDADSDNPRLERRLERERNRESNRESKRERKEAAAEAATAKAAAASAAAIAAAKLGNAIPETEFTWWDEAGRIEAEEHDNPRGRRNARRKMAEKEIALAANKANPGSALLRITLDLSEQAAYFYRGQVWVGRSRIATGRRGLATPTGKFTIIEKSRTKRSNLYGRILDAEGEVINYNADALTDEIPEGGSFLGASMPHWMRLTTDGIGMHSGPIPRPGRTASHGCVRMPSTTARRLFEITRIGTPVTIVP